MQVIGAFPGDYYALRCFCRPQKGAPALLTQKSQLGNLSTITSTALMSASSNLLALLQSQGYKLAKVKASYASLANSVITTSKKHTVERLMLVSHECWQCRQLLADGKVRAALNTHMPIGIAKRHAQHGR